MNRISLSKIFLLPLLLFLSLVNVATAQLPEGFSDELVLDDWEGLTGITFDPEGRTFAWTRTGKVFLADETGNWLAEPVIDISEEVANWWDMGMLGFTLDPNFLENGHCYLLYVVDRHHLLNYGTPDYDSNITVLNEATIGRLTRFSLNPSSSFSSLFPNSRKVLIGESISTGLPMIFKTHGVGSMAFGTDGTLLVSCGETSHPEWAETGSSPSTYYAQALSDGILKSEENVGAFRSQVVNSMGGKVLRIDPDTGDGLPSNPFYDPAQPRSPRSRVWAMGLRNPFKFIVRPNSGSHFPDDGQPGDLFIGDVGSNFWEELNIASEPGQNFGWPLYEGFQKKDNYINKNIRHRGAPNPLFGQNGCSEEFFLFEDLAALPILNEDPEFLNPCDPSQPIGDGVSTFVLSPPTLAYRNYEDGLLPYAAVPHFDDNGEASFLPIDDIDAGVEGQHFEGISSIPGVFYQGEKFPEQYRGRYYHCDYNGWIRIIDFDDNLHPIQIEPFHQASSDIVSLAENPINGCLYYVDIKSQELRRICFGGTPAPVPVAKANHYYGPSPLLVEFDGSESFSPSGADLSFQWDFGNGQTSSEVSSSHTFTESSGLPKAFPVTLTVTDTAGQTRMAKITVSLNNTPPQVSITSFPDSSSYQLERTTLLRLDGEAFDMEHEEENLQWTWRTFLHHDTHEHADLVLHERKGEVAISPLGCGDEAYWYRIELTVTDGAGLSGKDVQYLLPYCDGKILDLTSFIAIPHSRIVELTWELENEKNLSHFEIQRSDNIFDFQPIGQVEASVAGEYSFRDMAPLSGSNFYRLKIWNNENVFTMSHIVSAGFNSAGDENGWVVFPNPFYSEVNFSLFNPLSEELKFRMYNAQGKLIRNEKWPAIAGKPFLINVDLSDCAQGLYYYELMDEGEKTSGALIHK